MYVRACFGALLAFVAASAGSATLVGHWNFDETFGPTASDASGHGNHGTLINGPVWTTQGHTGGALLFDGIDDYVEVPDSPTLDVDGPGLTFMAWVTAPDYNQQGWVVGKGQGYRGWWMLTGGSGDGIAYGVTAGGTNLERGFYVSPPFETWLHFCVTYDGSYMRFYLNGVVQDSAVKTGNIDPDDYPLFIGKDGIISWKYFHGRIDDVRVYDGALSPGEIQAVIRGCQSGDTNCDGTMNVSDLVYMVNFLFKAGPPPCGQ